MKEILLLILTVVLMVTLFSGCSSKVDMTFKETTQTLKSTSVRKNNEDNSKILVVYYSSTGTTKNVAETIAKVTGGDLFELKPINPYSTSDLNYNDKSSRIFKEYNNIDLRDIELEYNTVDEWDLYDTVMIGYPIWWGNAAWTINSFVQLNNFEGKTVIPFCTSASSGIKDSENFLKSQNKTGNWKAGKRFSAGVSLNNITKWIDELGLKK